MATPIGDIQSGLPYMSAMSQPYSARFSVAPMMDWIDYAIVSMF